MLLALCITLCAGVWAGAKSAAISDSLVRLHVVAASDEAEEQELKLRVRDSVLAYLTPRLEGTVDAAEARDRIRTELPGIRAAAEAAAEGGERLALARVLSHPGLWQLCPAGRAV